MVNNTIKTPEEQNQLIKENEILGKVALEIVLRCLENETKETVQELFNREDWKEAREFSVKDDGQIEWNVRSGTSFTVNPRTHFNGLKDGVDRIVESNRFNYDLMLKERAEKEKSIKELAEAKKEFEAKQRELETKVEELEERVEIEIQTNLEALEKSEEWHDDKIFTLMAQKDTSLIEAQLKIQELEKGLRNKDEEFVKLNKKIIKLSKPSKLQQFRQSMNKIKGKTKERVNVAKERAKEKFNAYILQKNK